VIVREILLATRSPGKIREIREMTATGDYRWRGLDEFPDVAEVEETADSFAGNARLKALGYAAATGLFALADDSGLEVDALQGEPGVHSAYYAGHPRNDVANNRKLVAALRATPPAARTARFRCAMAFARPGAVLLETTGTVEGLIIDPPRGANGFGYDPHFLLPDRGLTTAELAPPEKHAISHRGRALRAMLSKMDTWFRSQP
jgi:XTP/dITP diphosphohydrolase